MCELLIFFEKLTKLDHFVEYIFFFFINNKEANLNNIYQNLAPMCELNQTKRSKQIVSTMKK